MCCKPKYRANIIHHFIFVFFLCFFHHSSCRKDQFTDRADPHWFVARGGGDSAYERGGDARRKFWIKPLKQTDLGVAQAFLGL